MGFDWGSFIGGIILGGIAGGVFVGWNALKLGANIFETAGKEGWINQAEVERDLAAKSRMARAYRAMRSRVLIVMKFKLDIPSFVGGAIVGGIVGSVFLGMTSAKEAEAEATANLARAYHVRARPRRRRSRRSFCSQDIYGHGSGTESDLNRIPIFL